MIDIIVLTYNHIEDTKKCIKSIKTKYPYQLIVVDSGSTDGTQAWCEMKGALVIPTGGEFNFSRNVNIGLKFGENYFKLICNNDIEFMANSIDEMMATLQSDPKIGLVGPSSDGVMNADQKKIHMTAKETKKTLNFFCVMTHCGVLDATGYMDTRFTGYGCDDDDFSIRVLEAGYKLMIAPAYVHHNATTTFKEMNKKELFERNKQLFKEKWGYDLHHQAHNTACSG